MCVKEFMNHYETGEKSVKTLTRGSLATLRKKLQVPDSDEVFLYHDDTVFNSGKNGFVFCTSGIITNGLVSKRSKRFFVSWLSFATGPLRPFEEDGLILFCTSGIIQRSFVSARYFVSWTAFATGQLLPFEESDIFSRSKLRDSLGMIRTLSKMRDAPAAIRVHQFFSELPLFMRTRFGLEEIMAPVKPAGAIDAANEQLALSATLDNPIL